MKLLYLFLLISTTYSFGQTKDTTVTIPVKWRLSGIMVDSVVKYTYTIYRPVCPTCPVCPTQPPITPPTTSKDTTTSASILVRNSGTQNIKNWNITMTNPSGIAFYSYTLNMPVNLTLNNIKQRGGANVIWSQSPGTSTTKATFLVENSDLRTKNTPICVYSNNNFVDRVTVRDSYLSSEISHGGLYVKTNISITMERVRVEPLGPGINSDVSLCVSHFSGNDTLPGIGQTTNYYTDCWGPDTKAWGLSGHNYLLRDTMNLYQRNMDDKSCIVHAKDCILTGFFKGDAVNVKGKTLVCYDTAYIDTGNYEEFKMYGGNYEFKKLKTIDIFGMTTNGTGAPIYATFIDSEIGAVANIPFGSVFTLVSTNGVKPKQPPAKWNNPHQPTYIFKY